MEIQVEANRVFVQDANGNSISEITFPSASDACVNFDHTFSSRRLFQSSRRAQMYGVGFAAPAVAAAHINPHAFRQTMASLLYFNGMDAVAISKRLGHGQASTTANIYAHIMQEADSKVAETIADAVRRKH